MPVAYGPGCDGAVQLCVMGRSGGGSPLVFAAHGLAGEAVEDDAPGGTADDADHAEGFAPVAEEEHDLARVRLRPWTLIEVFFKSHSVCPSESTAMSAANISATAGSAGSDSVDAIDGLMRMLLDDAVDEKVVPSHPMPVGSQRKRGRHVPSRPETSAYGQRPDRRNSLPRTPAPCGFQ